MQRTIAFPSVLIVLMGTIDCVTTIIGMLYFGAVEVNPLMAGVASTSLAAFTLVKMITTLVIGLIFYQTDRFLKNSVDKTGKMFVWANRFLKVSCLGVIVFLGVVISNNIYVLLSAL